METMRTSSFFVILFLFSCSSPSAKHDSKSVKEYAVEDDIPEETLYPQSEQKTHIVEIKQMKFEPNEVMVKKGDRVLWINKDITNHDVTEQSKKAWASSPLASGESWSMVVTESQEYFCNLHQVMKGKITVEEPKDGVAE